MKASVSGAPPFFLPSFSFLLPPCIWECHVKAGKKPRSDFPGQENFDLGQLKIWMFGGLVLVADPDFELQVGTRFCFTCPADFSSFSHFFFFHPK